MSKELEALERLIANYYEMCQDLGNTDDQYQRCNSTSERAIIETALEELEEYKQILDDYGLSLADFRHACFTFAQFKNSKGFEGVEKKLKALEILKKEPYISVNWYLEGTYEEYINAIEKVKITEDEWNFVKEVLL